MSAVAAVCRMCLADNVKMHDITNSPLEEIFEKLTKDKISAPGRPEKFCYICCSQLQRCRRFLDTFHRTQKIVEDLTLCGIQLTPDTVSVLDHKMPRRFTVSPIEVTNLLNLKEVSEHPVKNEVTVKQEPEDSEINEDEMKDAPTAKKLKVNKNEDPAPKAFACDSCEKSFEIKTQLDGHKRVHKKQRKSRK